MTRLDASTVPMRPALAHPEPAQHELRRWVRQAMTAATQAEKSVVLTIPAPVVPEEALLLIDPDDLGALWSSTPGATFSTLGAARELRASGADRFDAIQRQAVALWQDWVTVSCGETAPQKSRLFGGFAFREGGAQQPPWQGFGDAWFVLPRLRYDVAGERAWLSRAVGREELDQSALRAAALEDLLAVRAALPTVARGLKRSRPLPTLVGSEPRSDAGWGALVRGIAGGISSGDFEKVVAARRTILEFDSPPDPVAVLTRLQAGPPGSIRFALRRTGATFLGATPEHLVTQIGDEVRTEALAGSARSDDPDAAARLLSSPKELAEHDFVLQALLERLSHVCEVTPPRAHPEVHTLRHLLHLRTPVRARRLQPGHVLGLVACLHPTPAVGGVPTEAAVRWIEEHEPAARGWYAGPVGWFEPSGDGEFAVALRSGVLEGRFAYLYAGAGIVRDSEPPSELDETDLKLATLHDALGVVP